MYLFNLSNLLLQLLLTTLAFAQPISIEVHRDAFQYGLAGGIVGFIVLVLDIIVWIEVLKSNREVSMKLLWALLVFIFPIGGIIVYFLFSNRQGHKRGYESIA